MNGYNYNYCRIIIAEYLLHEDDNTVYYNTVVMCIIDYDLTLHINVSSLNESAEYTYKYTQVYKRTDPTIIR